MTKAGLAAATLIATAVSLPAFAQDTTSTRRMGQRQANQEKRIQQGEKSGQLTDKEAARLEKGQARIRKMEEKAKADGKVTAKERRRIEQAQNRESAKIAREKHDRQHK